MKTEPAGTVPAAELTDELRRVGIRDVRSDTLTRGMYGADASLYRVLPVAVVLPHDAAEVAATLEVCRRLRVPLTARGGGTSIAGNAIGAGVVLDTSRHFNRVLEVDPQGRRAVVEPGAVHATLQARATSVGLRFGPDPSSWTRCAVGGMIGNNACGTRALGYGRTSDNVLAMEALTGLGSALTVTTGVAQGVPSQRGAQRELMALRAAVHGRLDVIRTEFGQLRRQVSGYALEHLAPEHGFDVGRMLVGSEGTLAVLTQATVRLVTDPPARVLVALGFDDIYQAGDVAHRLLDYGATAAEALDARIVDLVRVRRGPNAVPDLPIGRAWMFVELVGDSSEEADAAARRVVAGIDARDARIVREPGQIAALWRIREDGAGLAGRTARDRPGHAGWEDAAVPPALMGAYLREFDALLAAHDVTGLPYGHFGDGCLHIRLDFDLDRPGGAERFRAFLFEAADLVASYGGSLSGEHGDGRARSELLSRMYSPAAMALMAAVKAAFDPEAVLNPGVLIDPDPVDAALRITPGLVTPAARAGLAFGYQGDHGDFARAVHRCTGVGKCRADNTGTGGVMCPSYLATREERDSTRGRARILQEMLEGTAVTGSWRSPEVMAALDLCLACKGCASDCPTGVDMATYKAEALYQYYKGRLRPLRHVVLGGLPQWSRIASRAPGLVNRALTFPGIAAVAKRLVGVDPRRSMPVFADRTFRARYAASPRASSRRPGPGSQTRPAVLFIDSFTNHFCPEVGLAALAVLRDAGYDARPVKQVTCCGLTWISTGQLDAAKRYLTATLETLAPFARHGIPIVGLEPSCTAVLRHDALELLGTDTARSVAAATMTLAELLTATPGWRPPDLSGLSVVAQPHCHHHAIMTWSADEALLAQAGADVLRLGGCCGLAGNFGVEAGHYEVSVAVAEQRLLPAVREAPDDAVILADGFSCRTQLADLSDRRGLHLAQLLAKQ